MNNKKLAKKIMIATKKSEKELTNEIIQKFAKIIKKDNICPDCKKPIGIKKPIGHCDNQVYFPNCKINKYVVIFSYAIDVLAEDNDDAIASAEEKWMNHPPTLNDVNIEVEEINE